MGLLDYNAVAISFQSAINRLLPHQLQLNEARSEFIKFQAVNSSTAFTRSTKSLEPKQGGYHAEQSPVEQYSLFAQLWPAARVLPAYRQNKPELRHIGTTIGEMKDKILTEASEKQPNE